MDYISITDTTTNETCTVICPTEQPKKSIVVTKDGVLEVPIRSRGKIIRTWMKREEK